MCYVYYGFIITVVNIRLCVIKVKIYIFIIRVDGSIDDIMKLFNRDFTEVVGHGVVDDREMSRRV